MAGTNYVPNPRPEMNTTGWSGTNTTLTRDTAHKQPGTGNWCIAASAAAAGVVSVSQSATGLTVGNRYTASAFCMVPSAAGAISVYGSAAGTSGQGTSWSSRNVLDQWVRIRLSFTANATSQVITWSTDGSVSAGQTIYFDRMICVDGERLGPYYDGQYPNCSWTGAAYASISTSSAFTRYKPTSDEPITIDALVMNTHAWNIANRTGRGTRAMQRGSSSVIAGRSGARFIANRPFDVGQWAIGIWILASDPNDGHWVPPSIAAQRLRFEQNLSQIQQTLGKGWSPIVICSWQPDGTVRTANCTLPPQQIDMTSMMGGLRGEIPLIFEILDSWWKDALVTTTAGVAGTAWSNQTLQMPLLAAGSMPIEDAVITVQGPAANPRLTTESGVWVQCNASVAAGTQWVLDCGNFTSTRAGTPNIAEITHGGHPRFLSIPAGELLSAPYLTMTASGTSTATNLSVAAARSHLNA